MDEARRFTPDPSRGRSGGFGTLDAPGWHVNCLFTDMRDLALFHPTHCMLDCPGEPACDPVELTALGRPAEPGKRTAQRPWLTDAIEGTLSAAIGNEAGLIV